MFGQAANSFGHMIGCYSIDVVAIVGNDTIATIAK